MERRATIGPKGPARTDRGKPGPFADMLRQAAEGGAAAEALAEAYADLETHGRAHLVDLIVRDATAAGLDPRTVLLRLLADEPAPEVARAIADLLLHESAPRALASRNVAVLARRCGEGGHEVLSALWTDDGELTVEVGRVAAGVGPETAIPEAIRGELVERPLADVHADLAPRLHAHLRAGGSLPRDVVRFL